MVKRTGAALPRVLQLEFNEICPSLLDDFMGRGLLPNFKRFYDSSMVFTTDADAEHPNLEPWIQWVTLHSGLPFEMHGIRHLGEGRDQPKKALAELLSDHGIRVGVFGSMNMNYCGLNGYNIPDPWDQAGQAEPASLQPFYGFVSKQVQESSGAGGIGPGNALNFAWFMARHGLKPSTALALVRQLADERRDGALRWRRACLLERLQYDLFRHLNRKFDVRFATFFCNSTAHFQHYYWRNMAPEAFAEAPGPEDHESLAAAILEGYQSMDRLLGQIMRDYPEDVLVLCSALSQRPWTDTAKCTYRPREFDALFEFAGLPKGMARAQPVMAEQFHVVFESAEAAGEGEQRLRSLEIGGEPLLILEREGNGFLAGCSVFTTGREDELIRCTSDGATMRFGDLFQLVHGRRSGRHHPEGVLWVRNGHHAVHPDKVPLTDVAPTILAHFGVAKPDHMGGQPLPLVPTSAPARPAKAA
ncbi:MAG: hypothetical protein R3349_02670 [Geminicoccaceae bacterium]|nr:hypothetical protein [Geminicoccaceae bacterium]